MLVGLIMEKVYGLVFLLLAGFVPAKPAALDLTQALPQPLDPEAVQVFADAFFAAQMDSLHVPGAVFVVVQDGSVVVQKGYGLADLDAGTPVDSGTTLFQVASVSKLFTATAVMQLAEAGAMDLQADVNRYLSSFQVEEAFDRPVTLAHLLTHTAGFDERNLGYAARDASSVQPLAAYLTARMPPRTQPPGAVTSYSNHGFGLLGLVVEEVSGESLWTSYGKDDGLASNTVYDVVQEEEGSLWFATAYGASRYRS